MKCGYCGLPLDDAGDFCAATGDTHTAAVCRDQLMQQLRERNEKPPSALSEGRIARAIAGKGDLDRARDFFAAWFPEQLRYAVGSVVFGDAVQALAQALADERELATQSLAAAREALQLSEARLRETIGIVSDISRLMPQIERALDFYARAPEPACGVPYDSNGLQVRITDGSRPYSACALPRYHRGPHGVTR